jgi:hypothetical protein
VHYIITVDGGNSTIKSLLDGQKPLIIDNVIADASKVDYLKDPDLNGAGIQKLDVTVTRHHNKKNSEPNRFLLGKITDKHKAYREPRADKFKANDPQLIDSIIVTAAYTILYYENKAGKNIKNMSTLRVNLGTGLPFHEWIIREQREKFQLELLGNHKIQFNHPWFAKNGFPKEVELIIDFARVCIEGETTANLLLNKEDNEFQKFSPQELLDNVVVLIDIGAYTTEIIGKQFVELVEDEEDFFGGSELIVEHQTLPILSQGIRRGIGHVMEDTINSVMQKYPKLDKLIRQDIQTALTPKAARNGKLGYLAGSDINILEDFTEHAKTYAEYIATRIEDIYNKNEVKGKIKRIYLTGGGSQINIVVDQLKKALAKDDIKEDIVMPIAEPNPVFANCVGYYLETIDQLENMEEKGEAVV